MHIKDVFTTKQSKMKNEMKHATQPQNAIKIDAKNKSGQEKSKLHCK